MLKGLPARPGLSPADDGGSTERFQQHTSLVRYTCLKAWSMGMGGVGGEPQGEGDSEGKGPAWRGEGRLKIMFSKIWRI